MHCEPWSVLLHLPTFKRYSKIISNLFVYWNTNLYLCDWKVPGFTSPTRILFPYCHNIVNFNLNSPWNLYPHYCCSYPYLPFRFILPIYKQPPCSFTRQTRQFRLNIIEPVKMPYKKYWRLNKWQCLFVALYINLKLKYYEY